MVQRQPAKPSGLSVWSMKTVANRDMTKEGIVLFSGKHWGWKLVWDVLDKGERSRETLILDKVFQGEVASAAAI